VQSTANLCPAKIAIMHRMIGTNRQCSGHYFFNSGKPYEPILGYYSQPIWRLSFREVLLGASFSLA